MRNLFENNHISTNKSLISPINSLLRKNCSTEQPDILEKNSSTFISFSLEK